MTVTYPLSLPAVSGRRQITLRQKTVVAVSYSPFTRQRQVQVHPGQWWEADIIMPPMFREHAAPWIAFLTALNGPEGTILLGDPLGATARGTAGTAPGTPLVKGGGQTGKTLLFDGAPASQSGFLLEGDWLQLGSGSTARLHMILKDVNSNGSGEVTVDIWPKLRASPADNAPVTLAATRGVFALPPGAAAEWRMDEAHIYTIGFSVQEVV